MVRVALPPPDPRRRIRPIHHSLSEGTDLFRIYDPGAPHGPRDGRAFRWHGPYARSTIIAAVAAASDAASGTPA